MMSTSRKVQHIVTILFALVAMFWFFGQQQAFGQECLTVSVGHGEHGPTYEGDSGSDSGEIRFALVGDFMQFQWGHADDPDSWTQEDTLSFDVSDEDVESITACLDGEVTYQRTAPPTLPAPTSTVDSLDSFCANFEGVLARYCELINKVVVNIWS